jgi:hypothetical protein
MAKELRSELALSDRVMGAILAFRDADFRYEQLSRYHGRAKEGAAAKKARQQKLRECRNLLVGKGFELDLWVSGSCSSIEDACKPFSAQDSFQVRCLPRDSPSR